MKKFDLKSKIANVRERFSQNGTPAFAALPLGLGAGALPVFEIAADTSAMTTTLIGLMIAIVPLLIIMKLFTNVFDGFGK
jgi:hypothetical protein